ncbi:hypothetical protein [Streptomyces sp. NPDC004230]
MTALPRPVADLEAEGCCVWLMTPRSFSRIAKEIDRLRPWVFAKGYWEYVDGELVVTGLRVGTGEDRVVAKYGDWLIRHPDGTFAVHKAPAEVTA